MVEVLLKIGKFLLVVALIYFGLWALNQTGIVDSKNVFLQTASLIPGLNDLADNYELGSKRNTLLKQKEDRLKAQEEQLIADQEKLAADRDRFEDEQNQWRNAQPASTAPKTVRTDNDTVVPGINQPATPEEKIKEYLNMLGKMKPKQAASVIQKLPEETVFTIFEQLNQFQVIKIMENLPEDYLAKLTQDRLSIYRNR